MQVRSHDGGLTESHVTPCESPFGLSSLLQDFERDLDARLGVRIHALRQGLGVTLSLPFHTLELVEHFTGARFGGTFVGETDHAPRDARWSIIDKRQDCPRQATCS